MFWQVVFETLPYLYFLMRIFLLQVYLWITLRKRYLTTRGGGEYNYNINMENVDITKVVKVGTSLGIIIPKHILTSCEIERGDHIVFGLFTEGQFFVRKLTEKELRHLRPQVIKI